MELLLQVVPSEILVYADNQVNQLIIRYVACSFTNLQNFSFERCKPDTPGRTSTSLRTDQ